MPQGVPQSMEPPAASLDMETAGNFLAINRLMKDLLARGRGNAVPITSPGTGASGTAEFSEIMVELSKKAVAENATKADRENFEQMSEIADFIAKGDETLPLTSEEHDAFIAGLIALMRGDLDKPEHEKHRLLLDDKFRLWKQQKTAKPESTVTYH